MSKVQVYRIWFEPPGLSKEQYAVAEAYYGDGMRRKRPPMTPTECEDSGGHEFRAFCQMPGFMEHVCQKCASMLKRPNET